MYFRYVGIKQLMPPVTPALLWSIAALSPFMNLCCLFMGMRQIMYNVRQNIKVDGIHIYMRCRDACRMTNFILKNKRTSLLHSPFHLQIAMRPRQSGKNVEIIRTNPGPATNSSLYTVKSLFMNLLVFVIWLWGSSFVYTYKCISWLNSYLHTKCVHNDKILFEKEQKHNLITQFHLPRGLWLVWYICL